MSVTGQPLGRSVHYFGAVRQNALKMPVLEQTPWSVRTFGSLEVRSPEGKAKFRTRKTAGLVALLATRPDERFSRDTLATLCWPDGRADASRQSLRMALSDIRAVLGPEAVDGDRDYVQINVRHVSSDVSLFETLLEQAQSNDGRHHELLHQALSLVSGPFLPDLDSQWVTPEWFRLQDMIAAAAIHFMDSCGLRGETETGARAGKKVLGILGCREDVHIALMRLYLSQGLTSLAIAQFEDLEKQLDDLWGEPPSQAAVDLLESAPRATQAKPNLLRPANKYALIGRDNLLVSIVEAILDPQGPRQITLIGPGGSGKTSLAKGVLQELSAKRSSGSWFVDLTTETTAEGAARRIQTALGLPHAEQSEAIPAIGRFLRSKPGVLVLDNFEQLVSTSAALPDEISSLAPETTLVVTSRLALKSSSEHLVVVGPLEMPQPGQNLDQIRMAPAIELFERQACAANPRFAVNTDNVAAVIELCRRLDGLPLAIELAAARIVVRSPAQILASIDRSLEAISGSQRSRADRHSSLAGTIDWSFRLLTKSAQAACARISLFAGRFDEESAQALLPEVDLAKALEEMIQVSFLNADSSGERTSFWMLETVRAALKERFSQSEDYLPTMTLFLRHFASKASRIWNDDAAKTILRLHRLLDDSANYIAALTFGLDHEEEIAVAAQLAIDLERAAAVYGFGAQLATMLKRVIDRGPAGLAPVLYAGVCVSWTHLTSNYGDIEKQIELIESAAPLAESHTPTLVRLRFSHASLLKGNGHYQRALDTLAWVYENLEPTSHADRARALYHKSMNLCCLGNHPDSLTASSAALKEARRGDDPDLLIRILFDLGAELAHQGRGEEALPLFDEAVEHCLKLDSRKLEGLTRWQHGDALLSMDRPEEALPILNKAIELELDAGFPAAQKWIFLNLAEALAKCGHSIAAARMLGKGVETRNAESRPLAIYEQKDVDEILALLKSELGEVAFERHWNEGAQTDWPDLMAEARKAAEPVTVL